ncbi:ankyrin repeat domain-containing protein [Acidobacteriota bacterium]
MRAKLIFIVFLLANFVFVSSFPGQTYDSNDIDKEMLEAIKTKKNEKVKELIEKGATLNFKDRSGPLHTAIRLNRLEIAKLLVSKGADVNAANSNGWTPIFFSHLPAAVEFLISKGADVNHKTKDGLTPLHLGSILGGLESLEMLVSSGADVNSRNRDGETPLFSAITKKVADFLISQGALVNITDNSGRTPLHTAILAENEPYKVAEFLLEKGAKINVKTTKEYLNFPAGSTPLDYAELDKKPDIVKLLRSKGAKTHAVAIIAQRMLKGAQEKVKANPTAENYVNLALIYEEKAKEYDFALQNYEKGISYADKNPWMFHHIGICYEQTGRMNKAIEYYQRSIRADFMHRDIRQSYKRLGFLYESGKGVERDLPKAVEMLRKSAELDDYEAQYQLGILLEKGEGIEKNYSEAVMWLRRSSNAGYKPAIEKMGQLNEPPNPHDDTPCKNVDPCQVEVPDDFYIVYVEGPTHAEWGPHTIVEVSANGQYATKERRYSMEDQKETTKIKSEGRMSAEAVKRIYAKVIGCGFFDMEKGYWNPDVRDGKREVIRVIADGKNHSVVVYYYEVKRFNSLRSALESEIFKAIK